MCTIKVINKAGQHYAIDRLDKETALKLYAALIKSDDIFSVQLDG